MGIAAPRILIVDDNQLHGEAIARKLWKLGYASLFVEYDPGDLQSGVYGPYQGVRLVFMDLDLAGEGRIGDGSRAFADVQATIEALIDKENGPWALVMWSTFADHADTLIDQLRKRLQVKLQPVSFGVVDKEQFINSNGTDKAQDILPILSSLLRQENAMGCLLGWEAGVGESASQVVSELSHTAKMLDGAIQDNLGHLLFELTKAEAGDTIDDISDYAPALYSVLTALLSDELSVFIPGSPNPCATPAVSKAGNGIDVTAWKRSINCMINFEVGYSGDTCPGAIFEVTDDMDLPHPVDGNVYSLIEKQFLYPKGASTNEQRIRVGKCSLYLIDITPPCDHSQKNIEWRRYVLACRIPVEELSNSSRKKLKRDCLKVSPDFRDEAGNTFVLVVNANLQISLCENGLHDRLGSASGRIKVQLMADTLGWLGRHVTRLGYVSLKII